MNQSREAGRNRELEYVTVCCDKRPTARNISNFNRVRHESQCPMNLLQKSEMMHNCMFIATGFDLIIEPRAESEVISVQMSRFLGASGVVMLSP